MPTEKLMVVTIDDGHEMTQSRKRPGAKSPLTYDADNNLGQVTMREPDEGDIFNLSGWRDPGYSDASDSDAATEELTDEEIQQLIAGIVLVGVFVAANAPQVKQWLSQHVDLSSIRSRARATVSRLHPRRLVAGARRRKSVSDATRDTERPQRAEPKLITAFKEYRAQMDSDEARQRFVTSLADAIAESRVRVIRRHSTNEPGRSADAKEFVETLAPDQVIEGVERALRAQPELVSSKALPELGGLVRVREDGTTYAQLSSSRAKKALTGSGD